MDTAVNFMTCIFNFAVNSAIIVKHVICWFGGAFIDIMQSNRMRELGLLILFGYGRLMVNLELMGNYIYDNNEQCKELVDLFVWLKTEYHFLLSSAHREPKNVNWIQSLCIAKSNDEPYHYYEAYFICNEGESKEDIMNRFQDKTSVLNSSEFEDSMVILKYNDLYKTKLNNDEDALKKPADEDIIPSSFKPLSISYKIGDTNPISIELPETIWNVGNELFSPVFVRKCLEYQERAFQYNMDYEIEIMDADVNIIELKSHQYIEVMESTIEIKTMFSEDNLDEIKTMSSSSSDDDEQEIKKAPQLVEPVSVTQNVIVTEEEKEEQEDSDHVYYNKYKCNDCGYITTDDDPDCTKCGKKGCMMAISQDEESENEDEELEQEEESSDSESIHNEETQDTENDLYCSSSSSDEND
jgi:rubrerythrin